MSLAVRTRALTLLTVALLLATGASYFAQTEFEPSASGCAGYIPGIRMMNFNNLTYCGETISVDETTWISVGSSGIGHHGNTTDVMLLGFGFSITPWEYAIAEFLLNTTVVEPNGTAFQGGPFWEEVNCSRCHSNPWFTPDNEAGDYAVPVPGQIRPASPIATVVLLVEQGS